MSILHFEVTKETKKTIIGAIEKATGEKAEYHRLLRGKKITHSVLDDIKGIGAKRRTELIKYFDSLQDIKNATEDELLKVPLMNEKAAKAVVEYFNKDLLQKSCQRS